MGEIFWNQGITFRVNLRERSEVPHIHCHKGDCVARFDIKNRKWMDSEGFTRNDIRQMEARIIARLDECREEWERIYGKTNW